MRTSIVSRLAYQSLLAVLCAGCATHAPRGAAPTPAEGASVPRTALTVDEILRRARLDGARVEFFDAEGRRLPDRVPAAAGSVSVHRPDGTGQDNYFYDESGRVVRHLRSHGEDYSAGRWTDVPLDPP